MNAGLISRGDFLSPPDGDTIRLLVTTDNHLGFCEKDIYRCNDSFISFEECMSIASSNHCDGVLLGGDVFHQSRPSQGVILQTVDIIRHYSLGKATSEQSQGEGSHKCQYEGTSNIDNASQTQTSMPVFAIHGNHDNPVGFPPTCVQSLLHNTGILNYFDSIVPNRTNTKKYDITPLTIKKGTSSVNVYGLGHIRDEVLMKAIAQDELDWNLKEGLNIAVVHQNRAPVRGHYLPVHKLPDCIPYVIWGHEHCSIPDLVQEQGKLILQPGSTVATSLIKAEAEQKHCFILEICNGKVRHFAIPLQTPRVLIYHEYTNTFREQAEVHLHEIIKNCLKTAQNMQDENSAKLTHSPRFQPVMTKIQTKTSEFQKQKKAHVYETGDGSRIVEREPRNLTQHQPLIRIKVTGLKNVNIPRLQSQYSTQVINYDGIVQVVRQADAVPAHTPVSPQTEESQPHVMDDMDFFFSLIQKEANQNNPMALLDLPTVWNQLKSGNYHEKNKKDSIYKDLAGKAVHEYVKNHISDMTDTATHTYMPTTSTSTTANNTTNNTNTNTNTSVSTKNATKNAKKNKTSTRTTPNKLLPLDSSPLSSSSSPSSSDQEIISPPKTRKTPIKAAMKTELPKLVHSPPPLQPQVITDLPNMLDDEFDFDNPPPLESPKKFVSSADLYKCDEHGGCFHDPNDPRNHGTYSQEETEELQRLILQRKSNTTHNK